MKKIVALVLVFLLTVPFFSTAQENDTVVLVWTSQPDSLFPDYAVTATAGYILMNLYSTLVTPDLQGNIVGDLATSWEVSEDQLTWTFTLRDNATWHDGTPLTAADVKFSYEIASDAGYAGSSYFAEILGAAEKRAGEADEVVGVQIIDDYTISITTTEPNALMLNTIAQRYILPSHLLADVPVADLGSSAQATNPVGSGPYRLVEWRVDEALVFAAFEDYYGEVANISNYIWKVVPEVATHYTELVTGAADVSTSIPADDFDGIQTEPGISTLQMPGINMTLVMFNTTSPFFNDVRTRQAIAHAVDRQGMIAVGGGNGVLVSSQLHPSVPEHNADLVPYAFDTAQAIALLEEAGWRDEDGDGIRESYGIEGLEDGTPFSVELGTWANPLYSLPAQIIQQNLRDIGIDVEVNVVDFNVYFSEYLTATNNPDFQFGMSGWFNFSVPTHNDIAGNFPTGSGSHARTLWSNERVDELVPMIPTIFDIEERNQAYYEVQAIVHEEVPFLYLTRLDNLVAYNSNLVLPEITNLRNLFKSIPIWSWDN